MSLTSCSAVGLLQYNSIRLLILLNTEVRTVKLAKTENTYLQKRIPNERISVNERIVGFGYKY